MSIASQSSCLPRSAALVLLALLLVISRSGTTIAASQREAVKAGLHNKAQPQATPRPSLPPAEDLSGAVPASEAGKLPSTADQYRAVTGEIAKTRPAVVQALKRSEALANDAMRLKRRLVETANRVQWLETESLRLQSVMSGLTGRVSSLSASLDRDRGRVSSLLAVLMRLQHDMPPVIAIRADDALGAARGAMLLGASLPRIYGAAAALARELAALQKTRMELKKRSIEAATNAESLRNARRELDQLLAIREEEANTAAGEYGSLQARLDVAANEAKDLQSLMARIAALRAAPAANPVVVIAADSAGLKGQLTSGSLIRPVVGRIAEGGTDGMGGTAAPGVNFTTAPGAQVVAPADSKVLFAGPYHKTGQVLILEMAGGYDLVLGGIGKVEVRPGDRVLAGEPLGTMPRNGQYPRLYFELRRNGKGVSPAPWLQVDLRKARKS